MFNLIVISPTSFPAIFISSAGTTKTLPRVYAVLYKTFPVFDNAGSWGLLGFIVTVVVMFIEFEIPSLIFKFLKGESSFENSLRSLI